MLSTLLEIDDKQARDHFDMFEKSECNIRYDRMEKVAQYALYEESLLEFRRDTISIDLFGINFFSILSIMLSHCLSHLICKV